MGQQAQEQEDGVDGVQIQLRRANADEEQHDVGKAHDEDDGPENLAVLDLLGGSLNLVLLLLLIHQQGGVHGDGVVLVWVHGVVQEGQANQNQQAHDNVHGVEDGLGQVGLIGDAQELLAGGHLQGDGAGQAGVPDHEAGIGGGDEKGIVQVTDAAGHFLGQQGAHDQAEAPVQPAADGGHHGDNHDGAHLVLGQTGDGAENFLTDVGGGQGGAQHQHQGHLHGEAQQAPHTVAGAALAGPGPDQFDGVLPGAGHGGDKHHDGQDDGEQERVGQPAVHNPHTAVGKLFQHKKLPSLSSK